MLHVPRTLTPATVGEMLEVVRTAAAEDTGEAFLLRGDPQIFCMGMDMSLLLAPVAAEIDAALSMFAEVLVTLCRMGRPVIAVVEGRAVGGGVGLAAAADYTVAGEGADFSLPEVVLGFVPGMIYPVVRRRIAWAALNIMAIDGNARSARQAHGIGLVDEVVEAERLEGRIERLKRIMSRGSPQAVSALKSLEPADHDDGLEAAIHQGMARTVELLQRPATQVRLRAMQEGEAPWLA